MNFRLLNNQWDDGVMAFGQDRLAHCILLVMDVEMLCLGLLQVL